MNATILYRVDSDIKDFDIELAAMQQYFPCTPHRTVEELKGTLVIGRYSVLPFYKDLEDDLRVVGSSLINTYWQHQYIADMQNWVGDLEGLTPQTWFRPEDLPDNGGPFIVKGATNSRKWLWATHMYAENKRAAIEVYSRLLDDSLISTQDIYFRKYVPLKRFFTGMNGLPITEEYRFFTCDGYILSGGYYWSNYVDEFESGIPRPSNVPLEFLQKVINQVKHGARFIVVDVARTESGDWIVIELNDGQQSGLSENDPLELYKNLRNVLSNSKTIGVEYVEKTYV
jgi:hypothetical protein